MTPKSQAEKIWINANNFWFLSFPQQIFILFSELPTIRIKILLLFFEILLCGQFSNLRCEMSGWGFEFLILKLIFKPNQAFWLVGDGHMTLTF